MTSDKEKHPLSPSGCILAGMFFGYLAYSVGSLNGSSVLLGILCIGCLLFGIGNLQFVRTYILKQMGIHEIDIKDDDHEDSV